VPANRPRNDQPAGPAEPRRHPTVHVSHHQIGLEVGQASRAPGQSPPLPAWNGELTKQPGEQRIDQLFTTDPQYFDARIADLNRPPLGLTHELQRQRQGAVRGNRSQGPTGCVRRDEQPLFHPSCEGAPGCALRRSRQCSEDAGHCAGPRRHDPNTPIAVGSARAAERPSPSNARARAELASGRPNASLMFATRSTNPSLVASSPRSKPW